MRRVPDSAGRHRTCPAGLVLLLGALGTLGCAQQPLLLLLTVDTLRADHVGATGGSAGLTPRLDALAAESLVFERAYAPTPMTLPSLGALHSGWHPVETAVRDNRYVLPDAATTLAERLRAAGWRTGAVVSNWVARRGSGLEQGFEFYDDRLPEVEAVRRDIAERGAVATTDAALALLDALRAEGPAPILLWVHYQDPHGPYTPPAGRDRFLPAEQGAPDGLRDLPVAERGLGGIPPYQLLGERRDPAYYRAGYKAEVAHTDAEIGRLLDGLGERGLLEGAVIAFAADHGEALGERGVWFAHGEYLDDAQVRVPLILRVPGRPAARRSDPVALLDLAATLAALFDVPAGDLAGRDLLAPGREGSPVQLATLGGSSLPRAGLVADGFKYVVTASADGERVAREELFALGAEGRDLAAQEPETLQALQRRFLELQRRAGSRPAAERARLDPADEARLRALGYLAPAASPQSDPP